jgi:hypothetical protein
MAEKWLYWLEELGREQNDLVGKKCAHLGEIAKIGLPVPHGFALSVHAYTHFMKETGATPEIAEMIEASGITAEDIAGIERLSLAIRGVVESKTIPAEMESITGIATNVCVESTARDGFMRDYHIVIPSGLTEGTSTEAKKLALANIDTFFGEVVDSEGLLRCWNLAAWSSHGRRHHSHHRAVKEGNNV